MTTTTTKLGLKLYNDTTDATAAFLDWRLDENGPTASNMTKIASAAGGYDVYGNSSGGGLHYLATVGDVTAYFTGMVIHLDLDWTCDTSPDLNINSLGAKKLRKNVFIPVGIHPGRYEADIVDIAAINLKPGIIYSFMYDGTDFILMGDNPGEDPSNVILGGSSFGYNGTANTIIGNNIFRATTPSSTDQGTTGNTIVGHGAFNLAKPDDTSSYNTIIGQYALANMSITSLNTCIGAYSGYASSGYGNVFIGYQAGYNEAGYNKLYIANTWTATPLIYGTFSGSGAGVIIYSQDTASIPLRIREMTSQAGALQTWEDPTGAATYLQVLAGGHLQFTNAVNIIAGTGTGTKIGTAVTQKLGFWNKTPVVQPASVNQAALTNSTGGSYDAVLADVTGSFSQSILNNNFTDIYTLLTEIRTALVNTGIIKGSA